MRDDTLCVHPGSLPPGWTITRPSDQTCRHALIVQAPNGHSAVVCSDAADQDNADTPGHVFYMLAEALLGERESTNEGD
jgi:hypothetical protein